LRELELANAEKSGLLRAALLDRDNLPPELLELKRVETIQQMREMIESVVKAPPETQPRVLDATSSEIAETVLSSEAALDKAKKDLQDQLDMNESLRVQLEMAKAETAERGSAELQQEVENLRRENALVKSMWYDMNQRLLSNTVILQRRSEAPKGWLGKQRAAVGGGASVLVVGAGPQNQLSRTDGPLVSFLFIVHLVGPQNQVWFSIAQVWWHLYCVKMYRRIVFCHLYPLLFICM
ncbi:hypothetical protein J3E74DRAFT_376074, partial [Bipolaris maydis]